MSSQAADSTLRAYYRQEFERLRAEFEANGSGTATVRDRAAVVDRLVSHLWNQYVPTSSGFAMVALGGFGRRALFPHSDVDLLFLAESEALRGKMKEPVRSICQEMWDIGLRVSPTTRTLDDCARFDHDNVEFTISLLDCRFLMGEAALFDRLHDEVLPQVVMRESDVVVQRLAEVTRTRHLGFANTIFHLEPNLKDGPGGLRDTHVAQWLSAVAALDPGRKWPESLGAQHCSDGEFLDAVEFLSASRCYLPYRSKRDENVISWEAQDEMAARGIATHDGPLPSAEWMRLYFRHSKAIYRNTNQLLEHVPRDRSSLYRSFQRWRSRVSNEDFSVVDGRVYLQQSTRARDPLVVLRLFTFLARHGVALSLETERRLKNAHRALADAMPQDARLWEHLRELLALPHAAEALRVMHSLGLLTRAIPEFET
jgi:[protein-PII] uridylyltransferase